MNRKYEKIKKILGKDSTYVVLAEDAGLINGDTFEILIKIQRALAMIIDESGFPKDAAKVIIDCAFMSDEELEQKLEEEQEKFSKNLEKLAKEYEKRTKKKRS